jgi:2-hydroxyacyl-CoA lyase 1
MEEVESAEDVEETLKLSDSPRGGADEARLREVVKIIRNAKAPLVLIGKGAAYAQAEDVIRQLIDTTGLPFLPSPMGKGVLPDSHPQNVSSARSAALKMADVVLVIGARLNWIFHFGESPKWNSNARFIQVDISSEELGRNGASKDAELSLLGDINIVCKQLLQPQCLGSWKYNPFSSDFTTKLEAAKHKNEVIAVGIASDHVIPLTYAHAFDIIKRALHFLSPPNEGGICYVVEGANTMDISRSIFPLEHPRLRLDAGTYATMGVGLPYAIAAWEAYNGRTAQAKSGPEGRKKIVAIEGDSAFGFSGMEVETMARLGMDILIFVINNGGIYFGDSDSGEDWAEKQEKTVRGEPGLRSWALGWEVKYEKMAQTVGGIGFFVRTPEELENATIAGFKAKGVVIVNVIIQSGKVEKPVRSSQRSEDRRLISTEFRMAGHAEEEDEQSKAVKEIFTLF